jgi:hypothetical protein
MAVSAVAIAAVGGAGLYAAAPAIAISGAITPANQTVAANQTAFWGAAWSGTAPYQVSFCYGNGTCSTMTTSTTSKGYSHSFNPCRSTTYTQTLTVTDASGSKLTATAHTLVGNGTSC